MRLKHKKMSLIAVTLQSSLQALIFLLFFFLFNRYVSDSSANEFLEFRKFRTGHTHTRTHTQEQYDFMENPLSHSEGERQSNVTLIRLSISLGI